MFILKLAAIILNVLTIIFAVSDCKEVKIWKVLGIVILTHLVSKLVFLGVWSGLTATDVFFEETCVTWGKLAAAISFLILYKLCIKRCKS